MFLLRQTDDSVTDICFDVGFAGTFSRTFRAIVGSWPTAYRDRGGEVAAVPNCFVMAYTRPSSFGEADRLRASISVGPMFNNITHHSIFVLDQDQALDFYVGKLGLEVRYDSFLASCAG